MPSSDNFTKELNLNIKAQHPVTIVHTDDPFTSIELIKDAIPTIRPDTDKVYYWSSTTDWIDISERNKTLAALMATPVPLGKNAEMKKSVLRPVFASPEDLNGRKPVFIVSMLSTEFKDGKMSVMQELRDFDYLVRNGVNHYYRLIIVANKSFGITTDYENIFGVINHSNPDREEIEELYTDWFVKDLIEGNVSKVYAGDIAQCVTDFSNLTPYVVNTLSGLSERQIRLTLTKSLSHSATREENKILSFDLAEFKAFLYKKKFDELTTTNTLSLMKPIPLDQVGGLDLLKDWLRQRAYAFTPAARAKGVSRPRGALLVGPSGVGKSLAAKAMGELLDRPVIEFQLSNVFGGLVGQSESQMKNTLQRIDDIGSCVLLVDEIDKVFPTGGSHDSGTTMRVLGKFLTWLQETESEVFVIMTANRIENIPPELLRKGRLDEIFYVGLPNVTERETILNIHLPTQIDNLNDVVTSTNGFSSSEIEYVVKEAYLSASMEDKELSSNHLITEAQKIVPMSVAFKVDMDKMAEWARTNARPASPLDTTPQKQSLVEKYNVEV